MPERSAIRVLESPRLTLAAASTELIDADLAGSEALAGLLGAEVPGDWPPPLFTNTVMRIAREQASNAAERCWSAWYLLEKNPTGTVLVGLCHFKGRPDAEGAVEIAYGVLESYQGRGYATEAVCCLAGWALRQPGVRCVTAETLPYLRQSIRVLEKTGFRLAGPGSEQGVIRYVLSKAPGC